MPLPAPIKDMPTKRELGSLMRKSIPVATRKLAKAMATDESIPNEVTRAHKALDVIGLERVEATLADEIPLEYMLKKIKVSKGQFNSWMMADRERARRIAQALNSRLYGKAVQVRGDILDWGTEMDKETVNAMRLKLQAAKDVEDIVVPAEEKQHSEGTSITIDFGSIFGNSPKPVN